MKKQSNRVAFSHSETDQEIGKLIHAYVEIGVSVGAFTTDNRVSVGPSGNVADKVAA
jgi:hypothetical protein